MFDINCYKCGCTSNKDTFLFFQDLPMCKGCMSAMTPKELKDELNRLRTLAVLGCYKCGNTENTVAIDAEQTLMCAPCLEACLREMQ